MSMLQVDVVRVGVPAGWLLHDQMQTMSEQDPGHVTGPVLGLACKKRYIHMAGWQYHGGKSLLRKAVGSKIILLLVLLHMGNSVRR